MQGLDHTLGSTLGSPVHLFHIVCWKRVDSFSFPSEASDAETTQRDLFDKADWNLYDLSADLFLVRGNERVSVLRHVYCLVSHTFTSFRISVLDILALLSSAYPASPTKQQMTADRRLQNQELPARSGRSWPLHSSAVLLVGWDLIRPCLCLQRLMGCWQQAGDGWKAKCNIPRLTKWANCPVCNRASSSNETSKPPKPAKYFADSVPSICFFFEAISD